MTAADDDPSVAVPSGLMAGPSGGGRDNIIINYVVNLVHGSRTEVTTARPGRAPPRHADDAAKRLEHRGVAVSAPRFLIRNEHDDSFRPGAGKTEWFRDAEVGPEMVVVPGLDTPDAPIAVSRFPITFDDWQKAYEAKGVTHRPDSAGFGEGRHPVINVSWEDAVAYVNWLSRRDVTDKPYRLLSAREWEHCCRAGGPEVLAGRTSAVAIQCSITEPRDAGGTAPVDRFPPNDWGLFDMLGNVTEWCDDLWQDAGCGAELHVARGGSWMSLRSEIGSRERRVYTRSFRRRFLGFRVARNI